MFGTLFSKKQPIEEPDLTPSTRIAKRLGKTRDEILEEVTNKAITVPPLKTGVMDFETANLGTNSGYGESISDTHINWFGAHSFIGYQACAILSQHWLIDLASTAPVEDSIRKGWKITKNDGEEFDEKVMAKILSKDKKMKLKERLINFGVFGRKYGLRVAIFQVESSDPDYYELPFNIDGVKKGSYKGIIMNDPYYCYPELRNNSTNANSQDFYEPEFWVIAGRRYHKSHCIIFRHSEVAQILKPSYIYGAISLTQQIFESVYNAEVTAAEIPQLIQNMRLYVMHMDLSQALLNPELMDEKLGQLANVRNNYGVQAIGEEESLEQLQTSLMGLDDLVAGRYKLVASVAQMPVCKIMKTDVSGGLQKGSPEEAIYHETLESLQTKLEPFLDRHYQLLIKSELGISDEIDIVWEKLDAMTEKEAADVNATKAQTASTYAMIGALSPEDIRQQLITDKNSDYSGIEMAGLPEINIEEQEPRTQQSDIKDAENLVMETNLDKKIHEESAESPLNDKPFPSKKDIKAEDYAKAKLNYHGLKLEIENPYGSVRSHKNADGKKWRTQLKDSYGYISGTRDNDDNCTDIFIKPHITQAELNATKYVYVIDQLKIDDRHDFDEHKSMLGYNSPEEAKEAYLRNYEPGWTGFGSMTTMTVEEFIDWLDNADLTKSIDEKQDIEDKSVSEKQARLMAAVAHNPEFAKKVGIPQEVGREFNEKDEEANVFDAQGEHWITIGGGESAETGEATGRHVKLDGEGHIIAGLGGKFNGDKINEIGEKKESESKETSNNLTEQQKHETITPEVKEKSQSTEGTKMNVDKFMSQHKDRFNLLTHILSESDWYKNQADSTNKSQASMIKADLLSALEKNGIKKPETNKELFDILKTKINESKNKEINTEIKLPTGAYTPLFSFFDEILKKDVKNISGSTEEIAKPAKTLPNLKSSLMTSGQHAGKIMMEYGYSDSAYKDIKNIQGAKYIKSGVFMVDTKNIDKIKELSKKHGLELSNGVKKLLGENQ